MATVATATHTGGELTKEQYNGRENGSTGFEESIDRQMLNLVALIESKYVSSPGNLRPFDLCAKTHFFSLDVISDASFGKAFGFLVEDRDLHQFVEINDSALPAMNFLQAVPSLTNIVYRWPFNLALPRDVDGVGFGRLMGYIVPLVRLGGLFADSPVAWQRVAWRSGFDLMQSQGGICSRLLSMVG